MGGRGRPRARRLGRGGRGDVVGEQEIVFFGHPQPVDVDTRLGSGVRAPEHRPERGDVQLLVSAVAQEQSLGFFYLAFGQRAAAQDELGAGEAGLGRVGDGS